jgi:DNA helicase-2/ATP-dependent DNA helicase PcrA
LRTIPSQFLFELGCGFDEQVTRQDDYGPDDEEHNPSGAARPTARFAKGQLVRHESFGLGRVKEFIDIGQDSIVVVRFNTGQTKSLMLQYSRLVKL